MNNLRLSKLTYWCNDGEQGDKDSYTPIFEGLFLDERDALLIAAKNSAGYDGECAGAYLKVGEDEFTPYNSIGTELKLDQLKESYSFYIVETVFIPVNENGMINEKDMIPALKDNGELKLVTHSAYFICPDDEKMHWTKERIGYFHCLSDAVSFCIDEAGGAIPILELCTESGSVSDSMNHMQEIIDRKEPYYLIINETVV